MLETKTVQGSQYNENRRRNPMGPYLDPLFYCSFGFDHFESVTFLILGLSNQLLFYSNLNVLD